MNLNDLTRWNALLKGPAGTPYEGGVYGLALICDSGYPMTPPKAHFVTRVFHPNVNYTSGEICLDILKKEVGATNTRTPRRAWCA